MIKLKNVSKYYYSKGVVTSGFSKINLELNMGEFVVITGESGSGKSTLLNVISGLDTYEDGEMYINGEETSHYNEADFENYRKKYIGNIFQHFNLVNSYTVYQNVELVLLLNGYKKKEIKSKILEILKTVDLTRYRNTKVSKLSGGQKQRAAIARALAKDTSIIVADEPTGNLDSKAAASVLKTLYEVSKDKLVVIVTHNYEQVEAYATRKIKMHDGKIIEDKKLKNIDSEEKAKTMEYKDITFGNKVRLGVRNAFNIVPKFVLLFIVYLLIILALTSEYSVLQKREDEQNKTGYNYFFTNLSAERIIIKKENKTFFTEEDYQSIKDLKHVSNIVKEDLLLDLQVNVYFGEFYFYGNVLNAEKINNVDIGRIPVKENEVILAGNKNDYYMREENIEEILNQEYYIESSSSYGNPLSNKIKIVGIKYVEDSRYDYQFYVSPNILNDLMKGINQNYSTTNITINKKTYYNYPYDINNKLIPNVNVKNGEAIVSINLDGLCKNYNCKNKTLGVKIDNLYFEEELSLKVVNKYTPKNMEKLLGIKNYDNYNGAIFISEEDYNYLYNKENYQSSVVLDDSINSEETIKKLQELGLTTLYMPDVLGNNQEYFQITNIFIVVLIIILTVALFFISYFIIKIILKSRNVYFSTIRILGASKKVAKKLLDIELLTVINTSYAFFLILLVLINNNIINISYIKELMVYLHITDYIIIYILLLLMSYLLSLKFAKKLFNTSAMNAYKEEV